MTEEALGSPDERFLAIEIGGGECSVREESEGPADTAKGGYKGSTEDGDAEDIEGSLVEEVAGTDIEVCLGPVDGWSRKREIFEELDEEEMEEGAVAVVGTRGTRGTGVLHEVA